MADNETGWLAEWTGSRLAAPGPGRRIDDGWYLLGIVERVSPVDPDSITVRWDNGRRTIERRSNLEITPIAFAAAALSEREAE